MNPIKKIKPILSDVRHPKRGNTAPMTQKQDFFRRDDWESSRNFRAKNTFDIGRLINFFKVAILTIGAIIAIYAGYLYLSKDQSIDSARAIYTDLKLISFNLSGLNTDAVPALLTNIDRNLTSLETKAKPLTIAPVLGGIPQAFSELKNIVRTLGSINTGVHELKSDGFGLLFNDGEKFTEILKTLVADLSSLKSSVKNVRNSASVFDIIPQRADEEYIMLTTDLERSIETLQAILDIIDREGENHFLILFENPTEIRPAGGFFGSYGDLVIQAGEIRSIDAQDIYYPEHFSTYKIVPPKELQSITTKWGPQDANWFFDFPTSAKKITEFIENSSVYKDRAIKFEGVIAINVRLVEEFLKIVGAIDVPEYGLTLTSENFLPELQKEVETGRDKKPGQNPKRVLKHVTPVLLEKLGVLDDEGKKRLLGVLQERFLKKDIKFYFRDTILESLVVKYGGGGEVLKLPADFAGDYLAVVNANVAGGKSDKFIKQKVDLKSRIDQDGVITDNLSITRTHSGQNQKDWWYRSTNQNYIKIFVPPTSRLETMKGNSTKIVKPAIDYVKNGYKIDPDLDSVERTKEFVPTLNASVYKESGKNVFGAWFNVPAGKSGHLTLSYANSKRFALAEGEEFQFILDKQSGVESEFSYTIEAPAGFKWKESKSSIFNYINTELASRVIINLTLLKDTL